MPHKTQIPGLSKENIGLNQGDYNFEKQNYLVELIPSEVEGSYGVLFPAPWGDIKRKSFVDTMSACGEVVHCL